MWYRVQRAELERVLPFSAKNAWSTPVDCRPFCPHCTGTGLARDGGVCRGCYGTGARAPVRGYSCWESSCRLVAYHLPHRRALEAAGYRPMWEIIAFSGRRVGTGPDGEPLVVPTTVRWRRPW